MKRNNKKGAFAQFGALAIGIVTLMVILVVGFLIMAEGQSQAGEIEGLTYSNATECATSVTCNATNTLTDAVATVPGWVPIVVIVAIGGVLLAMVKQFRS